MQKYLIVKFLTISGMQEYCINIQKVLNILCKMYILQEKMYNYAKNR